MRISAQSTALLLASCILPSLILAAPEPDPLFLLDSKLSITLTGPFERLDDERDKDKEYAGTLNYVDASGKPVELDADFQPRGNWRLDPRNCHYSQLWVDLRRSQLPETLFANQNRLKLVVQCRRQARYAEYVHLEHQAYRLFGLVSDYHFDTRLVEVTFIDSEERESPRTQTGFFIEHQNRLSERFDMEEVEDNRVESGQLQALQATLVSLFMYLIGNTDFSIVQGPAGDECCHNSKLLLSPHGEYIPIPYDFDASGYVDASYAPDPLPRFDLRNNRDRLYRGFCVDRATTTAAAARYQGLRAQIINLIQDDPGVSDRRTRRNVRYVEDFFEMLDDEREFERDILDKCLGNF